MTIALSVLIGAAFGFVLDRIGATNPGYIIRMLNLSDLHLMKTILMGIGVASILTFGGLLLGLVDPGHLSVKAPYGGVFIGGLLHGLGFAVAGYCPGTGLTAMATGRIDALLFVIGGFVGAGADMLSYGSIAETALLDEIAGGKSTLGPISGTEYPALLSSMPGEWFGIVASAAFVIVAWILPDYVSVRKRQVTPAE